jgi:hypothetical protein
VTLRFAVGSRGVGGGRSGEGAGRREEEEGKIFVGVRRPSLPLSSRLGDLNTRLVSLARDGIIFGPKQTWVSDSQLEST